MRDYLDFEKPIRELEEKIEKLASAESPKSGTQDEIRKLRTKLAQVEHQLYTTLTPWQRTQLARHPQRPSTISTNSRANSSNCTATAASATTAQSWAASPVSTIAQS